MRIVVQIIVIAALLLGRPAMSLGGDAHCDDAAMAMTADQVEMVMAMPAAHSDCGDHMTHCKLSDTCSNMGHCSPMLLAYAASFSFQTPLSLSVWGPPAWIEPDIASETEPPRA